MKDKLITASVVIFGVVGLALAKRYGILDEQLTEIGLGALAVVAGILRSMVLPEKKAEP